MQKPAIGELPLDMDKKGVYPSGKPTKKEVSRMLALYGHPFSSYTWKALIAFYANNIDFEFRMVDADHMDNVTFVQAAGPLGKFPVLRDGDNVLFESTSIIEYLAQHYGANSLIPEDPGAAMRVRMLDRVFDN